MPAGSLAAPEPGRGVPARAFGPDCPGIGAEFFCCAALRACLAARRSAFVGGALPWTVSAAANELPAASDAASVSAHPILQSNFIPIRRACLGALPALCN